MVSIVSLWLPILLSAVLVFIASSVIHMVLTYHRTDFSPLPREAEVMDALRPFGIPPGEYSFPFATSPKDMDIEKFEKGPVATINVWPNGPPAMGKNLVLWFLYAVGVGVFAAYLAGRTLGPAAEYISVFRISGTAAFMCYAVALWQNSIWWKRSWVVTAKSTFDGLVYALLTAGTFGWLWPG